MLKVPLHWSFSLDLHELWLKEGAGVKLGYLIFDHKSLEIKSQMRYVSSMLYTVGKIF